MSAILPLIGAWVGAIIAYYFGKENFQAVSESTAKLLSRKGRLSITQVKEVMMPLDKIKGIVYVEDIQKIMEKKVKLLVSEMQFNRAPVLSKTYQPLLIIHKSTLHEYLTNNGNDDELTLAGMSTDKALWKKFESFGVVRESASAADVKLAMQNVGPVCSDVFVTEDGTQFSEVIGWVTNVDLLKVEHL